MRQFFFGRTKESHFKQYKKCKTKGCIFQMEEHVQTHQVSNKQL